MSSQAGLGGHRQEAYERLCGTILLDHMCHELGSRLKGSIYNGVVCVKEGRGILCGAEEEGSSALRGVARGVEVSRSWRGCSREGG